MADSDDDEVLYSAGFSNQQAKGLLGNRVKNINDVMNGPKEDRRLKRTLGLCAAFLGLGLAIAVLGPTLVALNEHLGVAFPKMSFVFVGRSIGYLVGSVLSGFLFEHCNPSLLMGVTSLMGGIGLVVVPFCSHLWSLATVISMVGLAMGALDTGANVVCLRLWGKRSSPFLQALHFCFAVGAFVAPLLAAPFIATATVPASTETPFSLVNSSAPMDAGVSASITPFVNVTGPDVNVTGPDVNVTGPDVNVTGPDVNVTGPDVNVTGPDVNITGPDVNVTGPDVNVTGPDVNVTGPDVNITGPDVNITGPDVNVRGSDVNVTGPDVNVRGSDVNVTGPDVNIRGSDVNITGPDVNVRGSDVNVTGPDVNVTASGDGNTTRDAVVTGPGGMPTQDEADKVKRSAEGEGKDSQAVISTTKETLKIENHFQNVYIIIGLFNMVISLIFFYFVATSASGPQSSETGLPDEGNLKNKDFKKTVLFLMFIFYFIYVGAEIAFGGYIFAFATRCSSLGFDESKASLLNSAFWGAFAVGRGLSICLASVLLPHVMLILDMIGCILASAALAMYGDSGGMVLWVGTIALGLSMASLFPAGISWLETYYKVTGSMASILVVGSALGEMVFPLLVGWMFQESQPEDSTFLDVGPMGLMYVMLFASLLTAVIFAIMQYLAKQQGVEPLQLQHAYSPVQDLKMGLNEALSMEEIGPRTAKQTSKIIIPKPLRIKKHTA